MDRINKASSGATVAKIQTDTSDTEAVPLPVYAISLQQAQEASVKLNYANEADVAEQRDSVGKTIAELKSIQRKLKMVLDAEFANRSAELPAEAFGWTPEQILGFYRSSF